MIKSLLRINPLQNLFFFLMLVLIIAIDLTFVIWLLVTPQATTYRSLEGKFVTYLPKVEPKLVIQLYLTYDRGRDPTTRIKIQGKEYQQEKELYDRISEIYAEAQAEEQHIEFAIDGDGNVPYQEIINVLNTCRKAGIECSYLYAGEERP